MKTKCQTNKQNKLILIDEVLIFLPQLHIGLTVMKTVLKFLSMKLTKAKSQYCL